MMVSAPKARALSLSIVPILFLIIFRLAIASQDGYSRPPARPVIITPHDRSEAEPQQVHVSLAGRDYLRVSWITGDKKVRSVVEYGTAPGSYNAVATGEHTSYRYFFYSSGKIHHVKIGPLLPATTYYYRCGGFGPEFNFKTPPSTFPIEFAVAGDLGQTGWTNSTLAHVASRDYDVFLLPGDLSYADSQQPLWDSFGRLVEPHTSHRPWMTTEGNHEEESIPIIYPHGFKAYNSRWLMPHEESGSSSNLYYSFDVADGVHVIMLGSYAEFGRGSAQYSWLEKDVAGVDRQATPWLVVLLHAPWYNTNTAHQGEGDSMREAMEELLFKARVDVVFAGHVHAYERFTRIYDNKANACGPVYVTIGDGGNREGLALTFENPSSPLSMYREPSFGHGRLRVFNRTHTHWTWQRNNDANPVVADEVWLESLASSSQCRLNTDHDWRSSSPDKDEL